MAAICVYCASSTSIQASYVDLAYAAGTELAARGHSLVSGGGRVSMMGAVGVAARAGGARTIGVIPEALSSREIADFDSDELIVTTGMRERKAAMDDRADAFLGLPGGIGTLEEVFEIWTSRSLGMHAKPVVLLNVGGFYDGLLNWLRELAGSAFVRPEALALLTVVDSVPAAFDAIEDGLRHASVVEAGPSAPVRIKPE
ncbi:TIGR00730 family Rossman fold protein [Cryptosporangium phraense]|uniref:Cytokinin riboside 5'-monophosphate phosphoribohydrolase n=1 Tax=Cryptosporangium phraense TaxID=2593070 RepID=A0A545B1B0_9ACTN|nr:TIGR00730 family Rossman fold protein [Cryptosporangium phraense]TQS46625.1 TIGR00730 family Rossman fold protein [Cryptosporangium phraense]